MSNPTAYEALSTGAYAFLDLGCGFGGSMDHCLRRFGLSPGLGLEFDPELVEAGRRAGYDVFQSDVTRDRAPDGCVRFVSMMDFLEHLPDESTAVEVIERYASAARDFLFIRHPSFEDADYLASIGLKLVWNDWTGHPNMMRIADFERAFERLGWRDYRIIPHLLISDSSNNRVVPIDAPMDIVKYDASAHGPKHLIEFDRPVYSLYDILVRRNPDLDEAEWTAILDTELDTDPRDSRKTAAFYTPGDSRWHLRYANTSGETTFSIEYGGKERDLAPIVGDWDGDGYDGIGIYDRTTGAFYLRNTTTQGHADVSFEFGERNGIPFAGDWTGAGFDTVGLYFPETGRWVLRFTNEAGPPDADFVFGPTGGIGWHPVAGDWDGDGIDSVGLYEPPSGRWYLRHSTTASSESSVFSFGPVGLPVVGDWDGDGIETVGTYEPATGDWFLRDVHDGGRADLRFTCSVPGGIPLVGRWKARERRR